MHEVWKCGAKTLELAKPLVMGIVNVTPDSFSDGGRFLTPDAAAAHAKELVEQGAHIIDFGAESTRPGHLAVSPQEEMARLLPALEAFGKHDGVAVSVDTRNIETAREALRCGADILNCVTPLTRKGAEAFAELAAESGAGLVAMNWNEHENSSGIKHVMGNLANQKAIAIQAGCAPEQIVIDPGFGFGKTREEDIAIFKEMDLLMQIAPVLAGISRKRTLGFITGEEDPGKRLGASVAAAVCAVVRGAKVVRVHDVRETVQAIKTWEAL
ncbi:MAG: dihydropteroate synthase [Kiritimatiellae bacterium]|nr:dihydropteroate synthase [Kiritimatiellia bacterium]